MNTWIVQYEHRTEVGMTRSYIVIAEDDDIAADVGKESLENDESNWDADPRNWTFISASQVETCSGCGGERLVSAPPGQGAV